MYMSKFKDVRVEMAKSILRGSIILGKEPQYTEISLTILSQGRDAEGIWREIRSAWEDSMIVRDESSNL